MTTTTTTPEQEAHLRELEWLLVDINKEVTSSVKYGLEECLGRLWSHDGFKLVVSSNKSEAMKGILTTAGSSIKSCDITAKFSHHTNINKGQPFAIRLKKNLVLHQVIDAANFIYEALQLSAAPPAQKNGNVQRVMIDKVLSYICSAMQCLKQPKQTSIYPLFVTDLSLYDSLPSGIVVDIYLHESNIVTDIRAIEVIESTDDNKPTPSFNITTMFASMLDRKPSPSTSSDSPREEIYNGQRVRQLDHIKAESQDPNLISVTSKLQALETNVEVLKRKLDIFLDM
jgi:hypothetical protein